MAGPADLRMCTGGIVLGFARRSAKILRSVGSWRWRCFHKWLAPCIDRIRQAIFLFLHDFRLSARISAGYVTRDAQSALR